MDNNIIGIGANRWEIDTGIDPHKGVVDQEREDEIVNPSSLAICIISNLAFILTSPISMCCAFQKVNPVEDVIITECGIVKEVLRKPGLHYVNPIFTNTRVVKMGLEDIEIAKMSANDLHGNPLVVSAQFVYRISDSVCATYKTNILAKFLKEQGESALRAVLSHYPFDIEGGGEGECLRRHSTFIEDHLARVLQTMIKHVGVKIESFRLINVGYDPKMEKLLLARQEAQAEVTARTAIAEGTTGIIEETLTRLKGLGIKLTEEEQNKFATNLTLMLVNHGHTTLNLFQESAPSPMRMASNIERKDKEKNK